MVNAKPLLVGVRLRDCWLRTLFFGDEAPEDNVALRVMRVYSVEGTTHLYVLVSSSKRFLKWLLKRLSGFPGTAYTLLVSDGRTHLLYVRFPSRHCKAREKCPLANLSQGFVPLTTVAARDNVISIGIVPSKKTMQELCNNGLPVFTVDRGRLPKPLTKSQMNLLYEAFLLGYYEYPRKINLKDLASRLGLSVSAVAERLRKAEVKVIHNYILENILVQLIVEEIVRNGGVADECNGDKS